MLFAAIIGGFALGQAAPNVQYFTQAKAAAGRVFDLMNRKPAIDPDAPGEPNARASERTCTHIAPESAIFLHSVEVGMMCCTGVTCADKQLQARKCPDRRPPVWIFYKVLLRVDWLLCDQFVRCAGETIPNVQGSLTFSKVTFAYPSRTGGHGAAIRRWVFMGFARISGACLLA